MFREEKKTVFLYFQISPLIMVPVSPWNGGKLFHPGSFISRVNDLSSQ